MGDGGQALWTMQNGYALCSDDGLVAITRSLGAMSAVERDALRDRLRVGVHWGVQVTAGARADQLVSQAFCAALPVSYTSVPSHRWAPFATLVLEGAYEATLWAAVLDDSKHEQGRGMTESCVIRPWPSTPGQISVFGSLWSRVSGLAQPRLVALM